jgi:hypothetical protein
MPWRPTDAGHIEENDYYAGPSKEIHRGSKIEREVSNGHSFAKQMFVKVFY